MALELQLFPAEHVSNILNRHNPLVEIIRLIKVVKKDISASYTIANITRVTSASKASPSIGISA